MLQSSTKNLGVLLNIGKIEDSSSVINYKMRGIFKFYHRIKWVSLQTALQSSTKKLGVPSNPIPTKVKLQTALESLTKKSGMLSNLTATKVIGQLAGQRPRALPSPLLVTCYVTPYTPLYSVVFVSIYATTTCILCKSKFSRQKLHYFGKQYSCSKSSKKS